MTEGIKAISPASNTQNDMQIQEQCENRSVFFKKSPNATELLNQRLEQFSGRPMTKEVIAHDYYMAKKTLEFDTQNPPPKLTPGIGISEDFLNWQTKRSEHRTSLETSYREENPKYKMQIENYERRKCTASWCA